MAYYTQAQEGNTGNTSPESKRKTKGNKNNETLRAAFQRLQHLIKMLQKSIQKAEQGIHKERDSRKPPAGNVRASGPRPQGP